MGGSANARRFHRRVRGADLSSGGDPPDPSNRQSTEGIGMRLGYALSSEEHPPLALVEHAEAAEAAGSRSRSSLTTFTLGPEPAGRRLLRVVGHWCNCGSNSDARGWDPGHMYLIRIHPAIVAQAAATAAAMLPGRFCSRSRHRREPERAHSRRSLATGRGPSRDARRGSPSHP